MKTSLWHVKRITAGTHHPSEHIGLPLYTAKGCQFSTHYMIMQDTVQLCRSPASAQLRPLISLIWKTQLVLHVLPNPLCQLCGQPAQDRVCAPVNILQPLRRGRSIWQSQYGSRFLYELDFAGFQQVDVKAHETTRLFTISLWIT